MKKYERGDRIGSIEELNEQEFIIFNGKVYHKGFWQSWQYRNIISYLIAGRLFKAERTDNKVFVCSEINRHQLASEVGAVTYSCVKKNVNDAMLWVYDRLKCGMDNGFVVDKETSELVDGAVSEELLRKSIQKCGVSITMFAGYQENWDESYDIIVGAKEVE